MEIGCSADSIFKEDKLGKCAPLFLSCRLYRRLYRRRRVDLIGRPKKIGKGKDVVVVVVVV